MRLYIQYEVQVDFQSTWFFLYIEQELCQPQWVTVEDSGVVTSYWFPLRPTFPYVLYVIMGFRDNTLEYPMGPLRHGGIGPVHISTMD